MKFTHYTCAHGIATPKNTYQKVGLIKHAQFDAFETFAQSNTVSCPEDLMGEYRVEDVEIVWQYRANVNQFWKTVGGEYPFDNYEEFERDYSFHGWECQKLLQLKPVVKDGIKLSEIINGTITVLYNKNYIGKISKGEINGEWWTEPLSAKMSLLIKGKQNAIHYLIQQSNQPEVKQQFRNAFEDYPKLAERLLHAASFWKVDDTWSATLAEINKVCEQLTIAKQANWTTSPPKSI